ncbi:MAG: MFS transporter [Planctomycetota bacterium]
MSSAAHSEPTGYRQLIRENANFRLLWLGQIASLFGDWFNLIASAALVATLTKSGFAVGGLFMVRMLAPFLTSPIAGVVADRFDRKSVLVWTDILRGVTVFGFLLVRDASWVWLLYALTAVQLGISGFFFTARTAILPDIVAPPGVGTANAITSATWSTMLAVGAATGGLVAGTLGIYFAFIIDGLTFFLSAALIARISIERPSRHQNRDRTARAALAEYTEGLRLLRRSLDMLLIALHKSMLMLFFGSTFQVVQVAIAEELFAVGEAGSLGMGGLFAAVGIGTGVSPLVVRRFTGDRDDLLRTAIFFGYLIGAAGLVVASLLSGIAIVMVAAFIVGCGNGLLWVFSTQLLLQLAPSDIRGRVFASEFAFFTLASAAGAAIAGLAIDQFLGIAGILRWMAGLSLVPATIWGMWTLARFLRQDGDVPPS